MINIIKAIILKSTFLIKPKVLNKNVHSYLNKFKCNTLQCFNTIIQSTILKLDNKRRKIIKKLNVSVPMFKINNDRCKCELDLTEEIRCWIQAENTNKDMPWFGMDIGGTLSKLVFFEPNNIIVKNSNSQLLSDIVQYLTSNSVYGISGHRDAHLQMTNVNIYNHVGTLHFIRFSTSEINVFLDLAKHKGIIGSDSKICVTGGGAYKFEYKFKNVLNLQLCICDELNSLIRGLLITIASNNNECYYWSQCIDGKNYLKREYALHNTYPFIVVNIGSGVSILAVYGPNNYKRIFGSSIGGGTFMGLCSLLTNCNTFEEAIEMAANGDSTKVDKLVRDIYGSSYSRLGLPGEIVASSFGHMISKEKQAMISKDDLARATLVTITNNIASIARLCALNEKIDRVCFVGNFLRVNPLSMKLLSYGMEFWSNGLQKAIFLNHEGYFGAIGCLLSFDKRSNM